MTRKTFGLHCSAGDRRGVGNGRDQDAIVAFGELADRERRAAVDGPGEQIDLVLLQQLLRLSHRDRRIGLLVLEQELEGTPIHATGGIDLLDRELGTPTHLLADRRITARQRRDHADLDRIGRMGGRSRRQRQGAGRAERYGHCMLLTLHFLLLMFLVLRWTF